MTTAATTRRLRIRHTTRVSYTQAAVLSHNEVRMTPSPCRARRRWTPG